jgi:serine/threonine protein kinase
MAKRKPDWSDNSTSVLCGSDTETNDPEKVILSSWQTPGPGEDPAMVRPKAFAVVRLAGGQLALRKADSSPEYTTHEAGILDTLRGIRCVPGLICSSETSIYIDYVAGRLLPEAILNMEHRECLNVAWQMLAAVAAVHARGVVHADVRPWNFIYGADGRVYLFDFEYAYLRGRIRQPEILKVHHVYGLRPALSDWTDAFQSIADLWRSSPHLTMNCALFLVPVFLSWALRMALVPRELYMRISTRRQRRSNGQLGSESAGREG